MYNINYFYCNESPLTWSFICHYMHSHMLYSTFKQHIHSVFLAEGLHLSIDSDEMVRIMVYCVYAYHMCISFWGVLCSYLVHNQVNSNGSYRYWALIYYLCIHCNICLGRTTTTFCCWKFQGSSYVVRCIMFSGYWNVCGGIYHHYNRTD